MENTSIYGGAQGHTGDARGLLGRGDVEGNGEVRLRGGCPTPPWPVLLSPEVGGQGWCLLGLTCGGVMTAAASLSSESSSLLSELS